MLRLEDVEVRYSEVQAVRGISLAVSPGEIVTLLGSNGAGKSTTLKAISGLVRPARGTISFQGKPIEKERPEEIVRMGLVHVPEGRRIFRSLSVLENLTVVGHALGLPRGEVDATIDRIMELFPNLRARAKKLGWSLSGGEQQMLAIGRGLVARPRLMMLDEPSLGLSPLMVQEVFRLIREINRDGTAILLVEQNAAAALAIARRGYVLETGEITLSGDAATLLKNDEVRQKYLGI